jgi:hypothetical protein
MNVRRSTYSVSLYPHILEPREENIPTCRTVVYINNSCNMVHVNVERPVQLSHVKAVEIVILASSCEHHCLAILYITPLAAGQVNN